MTSWRHSRRVPEAFRHSVPSSRMLHTRASGALGKTRHIRAARVLWCHCMVCSASEAGCGKNKSRLSSAL